MARIFPRYTPTTVPANVEDISKVVYDNFTSIASVLGLLRDGHIDMTYAAPTKPAQGDIRYADGTVWDPGSGEGIYFYDSSGSWVKL